MKNGAISAAGSGVAVDRFPLDGPPGTYTMSGGWAPTAFSVRSRFACRYRRCCRVCAASSRSRPSRTLLLDPPAQRPPRHADVHERRAAQALPVVVDGVVAAHEHFGIRRRGRHRIRRREQRRERLEQRIVANARGQLLRARECGRVVAFLDEGRDRGNRLAARAPCARSSAASSKRRPRARRARAPRRPRPSTATAAARRARLRADGRRRLRGAARSPVRAARARRNGAPLAAGRPRNHASSDSARPGSFSIAFSTIASQRLRDVSGSGAGSAWITFCSSSRSVAPPNGRWPASIS